MAKIIKYKFLSTKINHGTDENPDIEQIILDKSFECKTQAQFESNYPIAEKEAVGEIEITGEFDEEVIEPSQLDRIESQVAYLAMMTGNEDILEV